MGNDAYADVTDDDDVDLQCDEVAVHHVVDYYDGADEDDKDKDDDKDENQIKIKIMIRIKIK